MDFSFYQIVFIFDAGRRLIQLSYIGSRNSPKLGYCPQAPIRIPPWRQHLTITHNTNTNININNTNTNTNTNEYQHQNGRKAQIPIPLSLTSNHTS